MKTGEQEELEQEAETLAHAEEIKQALYQAENLLDNEQKRYRQRFGRKRPIFLDNIGKVYPDGNELASRMESFAIELKAPSPARLPDRTEQSSSIRTVWNTSTNWLNTIYGR